MPDSPTTPRQDRIIAQINCAVALLSLVIVAVLVCRDPFRHSECPIYLRAAWDWWGGRDMYAHNFGIDGFLYLPQFALLYSPFALLDPVLHAPTHSSFIVILPIGDVLWRALALLLLMTGLWRLARKFGSDRPAGLFNILVWFTLPAAIASLRNGQTNLPIAALMLHAFADLEEEKWWRATLWLVLGFVIKPVMAVMILLAAVGYRKMPVRLVLGMAIALLLPFAFQRPQYVRNQYEVFWQTMHSSAAPDREFCNLHGLLAKIHIDLSVSVFQGIALAAAAATCVLWLAARRRTEPYRAFYLLALSACYIPLFNPRTESSAYVMLSPVVGVTATILLFAENKAAMGTLMIALGFCLICDSWAYHFTENWLKPLVCLVYFVLLAMEIFRKNKLPLKIEEPVPLSAMSP